MLKYTHSQWNSVLILSIVYDSVGFSLSPLLACVECDSDTDREMDKENRFICYVIGVARRRANSCAQQQGNNNGNSENYCKRNGHKFNKSSNKAITCIVMD